MTLIISKGLTLANGFTPESYMYEFPALYPVWSPAEITTALWLDAADVSTVTTESGNVSQWNDKSGNSRNASQSTSANRPTYSATGFNGKPGAVFNGSSQLLEITNALSLTRNIGSISFFFAAHTSGLTGSNQALMAFSIGTAPTDRVSCAYLQDTKLRIGGRRLDADSFAGASSSGSWNTSPAVLCFQWEFAVAKASIFYNGANGDPLEATLHTAGNISDTDSQVTPKIGAIAAGVSNFFNGPIAEIVVTTSTITTNTRQRIEGYLAHKWGLTANLPSDHPYKTVGPTP
jgi:hypothetical protein